MTIETSKKMSTGEMIQESFKMNFLSTWEATLSIEDTEWEITKKQSYIEIKTNKWMIIILINGEVLKYDFTENQTNREFNISHIAVLKNKVKNPDEIVELIYNQFNEHQEELNNQAWENEGNNAVEDSTKSVEHILWLSK